MANIYYLAPVTFLAFGKTAEIRLRAMTNWVVMKHAEDYARTATKDAQMAIVAHFCKSKWPVGINTYKPLHGGILHAYFRYELQSGSVAGLESDFVKLSDFFREQDRQYGPAPVVRLRSDLVREVINGNGISFRDLSVYAAINCVVGCKKAAHVSHSRMRAGAMGYKSARMLFDIKGNLTKDGERLLKLREDGAEPLTIAQVRTTVARLESHGTPPLISSSRPNPYQTFYSTSLSPIELDDKVFAYKTKKAIVRSNAAMRAEALRKRIREQQQQSQPNKDRNLIIDGTTPAPVFLLQHNESVTAAEQQPESSVIATEATSDFATESQPNNNPVTHNPVTQEQITINTLLASPVVSPIEFQKHANQPKQQVTKASLERELNRVADWKCGEGGIYRWIHKTHVDPWGEETKRLSAQLEALSAESKQDLMG